jgi:hypothetical protein
MKYKIIADLNSSNREFIEECGIYGEIYNENGDKLADYFSSTLDWLEHDILNCVPYDKENDSYTKNWK